MWEKPSYEIIDVCAEVTAYVYKDSGDEPQSSTVVDKIDLRKTTIEEATNDKLSSRSRMDSRRI